MRRPLDRDRLLEFMRRLGRVARHPARVYLVGGASAILLGWRTSTIDIDIEIQPERDEILRAIPELKESLQINLELASPGDFMPEVPGWVERSAFIAREGLLDFYHYDFYAQALSKIERGHERDRTDVRAMYARDLIDRERLLALFDRIEPQLYRFPAIDPRAFRAAVEQALEALGSGL